MDVEISQLPRRAIGQAVSVLRRAFDDDPILTHYLSGPRRRKMAYRAFFGPIVREHLASDHVYAALDDGRVVGVAVWRPPGARPRSRADVVRSFVGELAVRGLFPTGAGELYRGFAATERLHSPTPHWYLFFVGIDIDVQGEGIGSRLLAPVLELADESGTLCYIKTPFPRTHTFYRRLGFEIDSESHPFKNAPPLWTMTRPPAG